MLVVPTPHAWAQVDERKASAVKAAYLRYIAEFTTWPAERFPASGDPIVIGTLGDDRSGVVAIVRKRIASKGLSAQRRAIELRPLVLAGPGGGAAAQGLRAQLDPSSGIDAG